MMKITDTGMSTACYTYVSEISTPENRGIFQAFGPICASFGILLTYVLGYYLHWSTVALISTFFAVFTLIAVQFLPESPAYLMKTGQKAEGFNSYQWFRRNNAIAQREIDNYNNAPTQGAAAAVPTVKNWTYYFRHETMKPFFILVTLFFLQELSGIYTILFYAVNFFEETNLGINNYVSSIIVGIIRLAMAIVTAILLNKFGRKSLCMSSSAGMFLTMLVMASYMKYYEVNDESRIFPLLPLICVIMNVCFSMVGMLPIPWILVGEMFPLEVRSIMSGIVICLAQIFIFICVKIYNDMVIVLNFSGTLGTFCVASILAFVFCKLFLVETKNKSLDEIRDYFKNTKSLQGHDNKGFMADTIKSKEIFTVKIIN